MISPQADLRRQVRDQISRSGDPITSASVAAAVRACGKVIGDTDLSDLVNHIRADLIGLGPLEPLLADQTVTDVMVNGTHGVWIDRGDGLHQVDVDVGDEAAIRCLAVRLAAVAGRRLDAAVPFVDARLPGGVRLHAALPPLVLHGTHLSLRVPSRQRLSLTDLQERRTFPPAWEPVLRQLVLARCSFLVSGGTGTGKTTVLGALLGMVPSDERLVVVEDCAELLIDHPHVVQLEGRAPNVEGAGAVDLTGLVRQALRMRPDRLVVGEVRGAEVRELLAALNTGHEGGCGTIHANDAVELPARMEALGALAGMSRDAVHAQAAGAVQVVIHLRRWGGLRRIAQLAVVDAGAGRITVQPALIADPINPEGRGTPGPGVDRLRHWVQG
ncbi:MAG: TadA family conjugal transfer-associated ATPase [Angustibacter sp.]